ncbi:MAG: hypothetical protein AB7K09_02335 [Planctomycetota bacterium]
MGETRADYGIVTEHRVRLIAIMRVELQHAGCMFLWFVIIIAVALSAGGPWPGLKERLMIVPAAALLMWAFAVAISTLGQLLRRPRIVVDVDSIRVPFYLTSGGLRFFDMAPAMVFRSSDCFIVQWPTDRSMLIDIASGRSVDLTQFRNAPDLVAALCKIVQPARQVVLCRPTDATDLPKDC